MEGDCSSEESWRFGEEFVGSRMLVGREAVGAMKLGCFDSVLRDFNASSRAKEIIESCSLLNKLA